MEAPSAIARPLVRVVTACLVCACASTSLHAQEQPVVFVHGLQSSGSTWDEAVPYVQQKLNVAGYQPTQAWWLTYEEQGSQLQAHPEIGSLPASAIAFGHSNGGVVAREWSKWHPLQGVATLGTPHQGAPLVNHIYDWLGFNRTGDYYDAQLVSAFRSPHNLHLNWMLDALIAEPLNWSRWFRGAVSYQSLAVLGLDLAVPVINQMRSPSGYLQSLNSAANLAREANVVGHRVGVVNVPANFWFGGPLRLLVPPEWADPVASALHASATALFYYGAYVQASGDTSDPFGVLDANDKANWMMSLGEWLNEIDITWCSLVSSPGPLNWTACQPNDSVVPMDSQLYPGAEANLLMQGEAHTYETRRSNEAIVYVLHAVLGVPERDATPPEPPQPPAPPDDPPPSSGPPDHPHGYDILEPGEHLYPDQARQSNNGRFILLYQSDGNLVIYRDNWEPIWDTGTVGTNPGMTLMSPDGNFVVLDADGNAIWASNTWGNDGAYLDMQDDGNLVVYTPYGQPVWASNTAGW